MFQGTCLHGFLIDNSGNASHVSWWVAALWRSPPSAACWPDYTTLRFWQHCNCSITATVQSNYCMC